MAVYSIKDLENISGIKAHTLRIWEQRYRILTPCRTETNIRTYSDEELKRVLNIALLQDKGGFKISAIASMSEAEMASHILHLSESQFDFPDQIQALTIAMLDLDEAKLTSLAEDDPSKSYQGEIPELLYLMTHLEGPLFTPAQLLNFYNFKGYNYIFPNESSSKKIIKNLAGLKPSEYELVRGSYATHFHVHVSTLDNAVKEMRQNKKKIR